MKEFEIHLNDWARIFAGDVPPAFYGELVFRATYLFLLLILSMRVLGKRMSAQLSRNDLAAMASLAAAIGVPFVAQDRGVLPSTIIAIIVVAFTRLSAYLNFRNKKTEMLIIGDVSAVVENGVVNIRHMRNARLSRELVMARLRSQRVVQLGEVKRFYMESSGDFSLVRQPEARAGLVVLPQYDEEFINRVVDFTDAQVCVECGADKPDAPDSSTIQCPQCGSKNFTSAATAKADS
jgi:uncharacterized membrane protein YcaP (DUF421 family)